jgi:type IV secretory pathway VirB2 component (pilin)
VSPNFGFGGPQYSANISVIGKNFGNSEKDITSVTISGHICSRVVRVSAEEVQCTNVLGSFTSSRSVEVTVAKVQSEANNLFTAIEAPLVDSVDPAAADPGEVIRVFGKNFGRLRGDIASVSLGVGSNGVECASVAYVSSTELTCVIPISLGGVNMDVKVTTAGGLMGILPGVFSYATSGTTPNPPYNVSAGRPVSSSSISFTWQTRRNTSATSPEVGFIIVYSYSPGLVEKVTAEELQGVQIFADDKSVPASDVQQVKLQGEDTFAIRFSPQSAASTITAQSNSVVVTQYSRSITNFSPAPVFFRVAGQNPLAIGMLSTASGAIPEQCTQSQYLSTNLGINDWRCEACPSGAYCGGGPAESIVPQAGYYFFPAGSGALPSEFNIVPCPNPDACIGYSQGSSSRSIAQLQGRQGDQLCAERYSGNLCHRCKIGTARSGATGCAACKSRAENVLTLLGGFLATLVVLAVIIVLTLQAAGRPGRMEVMLAKIVITHLSTISLASSFELSWPSAATGLFDFADSLASVDSSIISPDCVMEREAVERSYLGSTYLQRSVVTLILPCVIVPFLAMMWMIVYGIVAGLRALRLVQDPKRDTQLRSCPAPSACKKVAEILTLKAGGTEGEASSLPSKLSTTPWWDGDHIESFGVSVIILLFLAHVTLTRVSLSLLTCIRIGNGKRYLLEDLSVECGTAKANGFQFGVGLIGFLLYGLGIPAIAFAVLYRRRNSLTKPKNMRVYGFIYSGFKNQWYYWESLVSLRKVGMSIAAIFLSQVGPFTQALGAQLILVGAAIVHARARPYTRVLLNNMESLSIGVSLITFVGGLYLFSKEASGAGMRVILTAIIIGTNSLFLFCALYFMVATVMGWHKVQWVGATRDGRDSNKSDAPNDKSLAGRTKTFMKSIRRIVVNVNAGMTLSADGANAIDDDGTEATSDDTPLPSLELKRASLGFGVLGQSDQSSDIKLVQLTRACDAAAEDCTAINDDAVGMEPADELPLKQLSDISFASKSSTYEGLASAIAPLRPLSAGKVKLQVGTTHLADANEAITGTSFAVSSDSKLSDYSSGFKASPVAGTDLKSTCHLNSDIAFDEAHSAIAAPGTPLECAILPNSNVHSLEMKPSRPVWGENK